MVATAFPAYSPSVHKSRLTATVRAADGVRLVVTADNLFDRTAQLANYVRERCDYVLWPAEADRVRALIDTGEPEAAIELYFEHVGERWDEERLEITAP